MSAKSTFAALVAAPQPREGPLRAQIDNARQGAVDRLRCGRRQRSSDLQRRGLRGLISRAFGQNSQKRNQTSPIHRTRPKGASRRKRQNVLMSSQRSGESANPDFRFFGRSACTSFRSCSEPRNCLAISFCSELTRFLNTIGMIESLTKCGRSRTRRPELDGAPMPINTCFKL